jgi:hypothetical protein
MEEYQAYFVGRDGHFNGYEPFVCADDAAAIEKAKRLVNRYGIELWTGVRLVKRLDVTGKPRGETVSHEIKDGRTVPKK